jgi:tetratricopeptide (TPR) repeat protein
MASKSTLTWLAGGIVAAGAALWVVLKWGRRAAQTAGPVTKAVATTTAAVVTTAALTASFSDKASDLSPLGKQVASAVADGKAADATRAVDELAAKLDERLKQMSAGGSAGKAANEQLLRRTARIREAVDLMRANIRRASGELSPEQWEATYRERLTKSPQDAALILDAIVAMGADKTVPTDGARSLLKSDLPRGARGKLASWLLARGAGSGASGADFHAFYRDLLAGACDADIAPQVLNRYLEAARRRGDVPVANQTLSALASGASDTALGSAALKLTLPPQEDPRRPEAIDRFVRGNPGLPLEQSLRVEYTNYLVNQGRFAEAVRLSRAAPQKDKDARSGTRRELAAAVAARIRETVERNAQPAQSPQPAAVAGAADAPAPAWPPPGAATPLRACTKEAHRLATDGEAAFAAELLLAALTDDQATPTNLATGRPVLSADELGNVNDPVAARQVVDYLAAVAVARTDGASAGRAAVEKLLPGTDSKTLRPYLCVLAAAQARAAGDYAAGKKWAAAASTLAPESLVVLRLGVEIESARLEAEWRKRLAVRIEEASKALEINATPDATLAAADELAQLQLARGGVEQAVGTYLRAAKRYPDHPRTKELLARCLDLLRQAGETSSPRVERIRRMASPTGAAERPVAVTR